MKNKDWKRCIELRGKSFERNFETFLTIHHKNDEKDNKSTGKAFAVMQVGEPSSGMNASVLAFVRILILNGRTVFGVNNGFEGLVEGKLFQMKWSDVNAWTCESGALLGTSKVPIKITPKQLKCIAEQLRKNKINGILVIGGFAGFRMIREILNGRKSFEESLPELKIPICLIPATINNNIPGSELSLGTDSTLNKITNLCTDILISNRGITGRVYIVKVKSGYCGYLTVMSALASGAEYCYIFEDNFNENDVRKDAKSLKNKMISDKANRLVIM